MKRFVVLGHGGFAEGIRQNLEMISGVPQNMHFIDLTKEDDLDSFKSKVAALLESFADDEVLFVCDLMGASPFRIAAEITLSHPGKYYTVTGLNTMANLELAMSEDSDLTISELADRAIETTRTAILKFPE